MQRSTVLLLNLCVMNIFIQDLTTEPLWHAMGLGDTSVHVLLQVWLVSEKLFPPSECKLAEVGCMRSVFSIRGNLNV